MRKVIAVTAVLAASTFSTSLLAAPAGADDTSVTFTIAGGGLSMSLPSNPSVKLTGSNLALGTTSVTGALNATTVTDQRGALASSWTVQISSSDWVGPEMKIPAANGTAYIDVADVAALASAGMLTGGAVATSVATAASPAKLGAGTTAEKTLVAGTTAVSGSITYTPTVKVTIPADAPAGTYTGTVTQTAS